MKFHDKLNSKLFEKDVLKEEVNDKLNEIADAFIEFLDIPRDAIKDAVITGSNVSYNYTKNSDLDLHLLVDYDKVHEDCPLVNGYLISKKSEFNKNHDIFIYDIPVEVYAESIDNDNVHNGLWSIWDKEWIDFPQKIEPTNNDSAVQAKYQEFKDAIEQCDDSEVAIELMDKLKKMRKAGLEKEGEFSTENLAFKKLRDEKMIDKLAKIKKEQIDKQLSLESYNEDNTEDIVRPRINYKDYIEDTNIEKQIRQITKTYIENVPNLTRYMRKKLRKTVCQIIDNHLPVGVILPEISFSGTRFWLDTTTYVKESNTWVKVNTRWLKDNYNGFNWGITGAEQVAEEYADTLNEVPEQILGLYQIFWKKKGMGPIDITLTQEEKAMLHKFANVEQKQIDKQLSLESNESIKESYRRLTKTEMEIEKLLNANGFKTSEVHQDPGKEKKIFYVNKSVKLDGMQPQGTEVSGKNFKEILRKLQNKFNKNESVNEDIMDGFVYTIKLPIKDKFIDYVDLYEVNNSPELIDVQFVAKNKDGNTMPIYIANGIIDSSDGKWNKYPEVKYNVYHLKDKEISNYILQNFSDFINNRSYKLDELQKVIVEKIKELDNKMDEDIATLQDKIDQAEIDLQDLLNTVKEKSLITKKSDFEVGNIVIFKNNKDKRKYGSTLAEISSINNNILELKRLDGETIGKVLSSKVIPFDRKEKAVNENTFNKINKYLNEFQV